jgi:hypothetical protein
LLLAGSFPGFLFEPEVEEEPFSETSVEFCHQTTRLDDPIENIVCYRYKGVQCDAVEGNIPYLFRE